MAADPKPLTRDQLAKFLPDAEAIKRFERLFAVAGDLTPTDVATLYHLTQEASIDAGIADSKAQTAMDLILSVAQEASINAGAADNKAGEALDLMSRIAKSLEVLAKAPPAQADNSLKTDYLDFLLSPRYTRTPGRVHWGQTGTLEIEMGGGNITQQVGEEFFAYGKATAGIVEGQLIMVTGAVGASGVITFAPTSTGLLDPNAVLGIATEDIPVNGFGRVTTMGVVRGINTTGASVGETWADGDVLWYNAAFVGGMTKVKPAAPDMKTQVAIVINASGGGSGSLQVEVVHGSTLGGTDSNVQLGTLLDKQLLQYDATLGYWKNVDVSAIGSTAAETHASASKTTPVDADEIPLVDSASSFSLKKLTWANLKATLATWIGGNNIAGSFTSLVSSTTGKVATTFGVGNATPSASGSGISFPATQSASTDPNTLDDYEEGAWTPTISASSGSITSYSVESAKYTKVGNLVCINFSFTIINNGTGAAGLIMTLPFVASGTDNGIFRENSFTGKSGCLITYTSSPNCSLVLYDNSYPALSGSSISGTLTYKV